MRKKEWLWMDKISGQNHQYNEGKQLLQNGRSERQIKASNIGCFISGLGIFFTIIYLIFANLR